MDARISSSRRRLAPLVRLTPSKLAPPKPPAIRSEPPAAIGKQLGSITIGGKIYVPTDPNECHHPSTVKEEIEAVIKEQKALVTHCGMAILRQLDFRPISDECRVDLVVAKPRDLGFGSLALLSDVYGAATETHLDLCPGEIAFYLLFKNNRELIKGMLDGQTLITGMRPIKNTIGRPSILGIVCNGVRNELRHTVRAFNAMTGTTVSPNDRILFTSGLKLGSCRTQVSLPN